MLSTKTTRKSYHEATNHSYLSVLIDPNYVDASTQPTPFKFYPKFYRRFPLESENYIHSFIALTSQITFEKIYSDGPYQLRVNPSAGALYPTEIYVQIRGIKGIIDGIYHLEVASNSLTLIYELIDDGLEGYLFPDRLVKGFIFLVSCVYFRSSWKYKNRSIRYCFLDSGHHIGAIEAAAYIYDRNIQIVYDFDKEALNEDLGFENKEFATVAVISGEIKEKTTRRLRSKIPFVSGTDYFEPNQFIERGYKDTIYPTSYTGKLEYPLFNFGKKKFLETVLKRRSARRFKQQSIDKEDLLNILEILEQPIASESFEEIEIYLVINRVSEMVSGLYRGINLLKTGDFSEKAGYLCINQAIARDSAVTLFFVSAYQNYQTAVQSAGLLGQRVYLASNYLGIGCSGIGAYYDEETKEFLGTDKDVLYVTAIGN